MSVPASVAFDSELAPAAPTTLSQAGLSFDLVMQLLLKTLHLAGELSGAELACRLGLAFSVIEPVLEFVKRERQAEIIGGALFGGAAYHYRITDAGRARAVLFLDHNHYVGVAPVPLSQYQSYMRRFRRTASTTARRGAVREAFSHLVLPARVLDQVGAAVAAGRSMFIYGPPGNGKTVISQAIRNLLQGDIWIPHALAVQNDIVRFFDPVTHDPVDDPEDVDDGLDSEMVADGRWRRCRRPMITVGGELTLSALDLAYDATAGVYHAPLQARANGGVLVIDDFGRQSSAPAALLNRWIVPLESRVDYLALHTGQKIEMPFEVLVVFATNIRPLDLVDEAFLRRIHHKIFAESPSIADFLLIFERCCAEQSLTFDPSVVEQMLQHYYRPRHIALRGCHPRDLIEHALALAEYNEEPRRLTPQLLEAACAAYFVDDQEVPPTYA